MSIDFNASPEEIFTQAAKAAALAKLRHDAALASIEPLQTAANNAAANLQWAATHPGLADVDKGALYNAAVEGLTLEDADQPAQAEKAPIAEPEKPKRKRRTKAEIEAERKAQEAATAPQAAPAAEPEPAPAQPAPEPAPAPQQVQQAAPEQAPAAPPAPPAPAPAVAGDPFDPFGIGQN